MHSRLILVTIIIVTLITACTKRDNNTWNRFRGPNGSGVASPYENPPIEFGEDKNLIWKTELPVGSSSPVIWNDKIFLTGFIEEKSELKTICIDKNNGEILWSDSVFPEKLEKHHAAGNPAPATITVDESGIYSYFASSGLRCYDFNGNMKWDSPVIQNGWSAYGNPSSPVIIENKIIIFHDYGGDKERSLLAINKTTGDTLWNSLIQKITPFEITNNMAAHSTPIRYKDQIIIFRACGIASYSVTDGSPIWWLPFKTCGNSSPVIFNNKLYFSAWNNFSEKERRGDYLLYDTFEKTLNDFDKNDDKLISKDEIPDDLLLSTRPDASEGLDNDKRLPVKIFYNSILDKDKNGFVNQEEWLETYKLVSSLAQDVGTTCIPLNLSGEISEEDFLWTQLKKSPEVPSPLAYNNCIYTVKNGGWVTCMDAESGVVYFQNRIGTAGTYIASPLAANGHIYLASHNGVINVIKANKELLSIYKTKLKGKITATPAIVGNNLYIRTSEYLYAFGEE